MPQLSPPAPRQVLLDVTRTLSRVGAGGDSGVDRVERAYIRRFLDGPEEAFFIARVLGGYALLAAPEMERFLATSDQLARSGPVDLLARLARRQSPERRRAEAALRSLALGWASAGRTPGLLRRHLRPGFAAVAVGHVNLDPGTLGALRQSGAGRIAVMIHDAIPLDFPEYARPETPERFRAMLRAVSAHADLVIYNSAHTAERAGAALRAAGREPESVTALLGIGALPPAPAPAPGQAPPVFVTIGTIEPRKNHLLLLSVWRRLSAGRDPARVPQLHIVGRRGWENANITAVLDRAPFMGRTVFEHGHIPDAELSALMGRAHALLFPSFAEGFGLPLGEALAQGLPAICSDLAPFREIAGDAATFLDPLDGPGWIGAIGAAAAAAPRRIAPPPLPGWDDHFAAVMPHLTTRQEA